MRRKRLGSVCILALMLAAPAALLGQETTGAIEGVVRDTSGGVLPGATIQAVGPAGNLVAVADARGEFRFPRVPSGRYKLTATLSGFAPGEAEVDLTVGMTQRAEFSLALSGVAETIEVTSVTPAIDISSPMTATNISRERIALVPRGRDFTDVVAQAAGAQNESQAGGISIDGSSGSENRFIIDGIDTTSPQVGTNAVPMRAELFEEIQVKSAGYAAEFGGSTGGVINAITRSGSNTWRGGIFSDFESRSWGGSERALLRRSLTDTSAFVYVNPPKDEQTRYDPGIFLGGPVWRDHIWFFGSYVPGIQDTDRTVNFTNGVTNTFPETLRVHYGAFNITGNAGSKVLYRAGANFSPAETTGVLPPQDGRTSLTEASDYARGVKRERNTWSGSVDYIAAPSLVLSGRVGRFHTDMASTGVSFPGLIHNFSTVSTPDGIAAIPDQFRRQPGFLSDVLVDTATARDQYNRDYIGADATWYVTAGGDHQIKAGLQTERIFNDVQRGYNADRILYYAGLPYTEVSTGRQVRGTYGYFRLLNISTLGNVASRNNALFIQDTWRVTPRLTLSLGLRTEHERIPNFGTRGVKNPIEFTYGEKLAPRLGFVLDPTGDQQWKVYGSFGKYYDVMKYELPRGSFGGDRWVDFFYTWDSPNWELNASGCATGSNTATERPTCPAGAFIEALDRRHNSAEDPDEGIDPNLKPMEENEWQLGLQRELTRGVVVGARFVYKDLARTIEDVGITQCSGPGSCGEIFYIANPGEGISLTLNDPSVPQFPRAVRDYRALELTFERRYAQNWALFGSYTLSRLYGNYSGLASSDEDGRTSPNVNRFFDHIENSFDRNGNVVLGRLGTDRPHQFRAQLIYGFNWNMTVGVNQYVASGIPVSEEAFVSAHVPFFPYGRGNLGRTDRLSRTDLSLYQNFRLANLDLRLGATVLNAFDQDQVTRRWRERMIGSLPLTTPQFFNTSWNYESLLTGRTDLDPRFNQPDQFQAARQVRLSVTLQF